MVNKDDDDASLPPLLKRLSKEFGSVIGDFDDEVDDESGDFGTMIVKPNRGRSSSRGSGGDWNRRSDVFEDQIVKRRYDDESYEEREEEGFSTFVVKEESESVSGTMMRRSGGGGNVRFGGTTTMGRAVVSMQAIGELGVGSRKKN